MWEKFDAIYCLSLADNIEKRKSLVKELKRVNVFDCGKFHWKITVKNELYKYIWNNSDFQCESWWRNNTNALNCTMGHYEIWKECLAMGYNNVLIMEDDIRFLKNINAIKESLDNLPEDYDIALFDKVVSLNKERYPKNIDNNKINDYYIDFSNVYFGSNGCYAMSKKAMEIATKSQENHFQPADFITNRIDYANRVINEDGLKRVAIINNLAVQDMRLKGDRMTEIDKTLYDKIVDLNDYNLSKKYAVLTYIFNGYENVHEIKEKDDDAEYILVTDDPNLTSTTWNVIYKPYEGYSTFDKCYDVRFHPFDYTSSPIIIRVDGSIEIKKSLRQLIDIFEKKKCDRCLMIHPERNTMKDEYETWINVRGYPKSQANKCLSFMENMGYDINNYKGLYQGCFEILRNNQINTDINDKTYEYLVQLGENGNIERLDQTITSFVINKFYSDKLNVMLCFEDIITKGQLMQWYKHKSNTKMALKTNTIAPFLFNKPINLKQPNKKEEIKPKEEINMMNI